MHGLELRFNSILKLLTFSDVFLWSGYYMMNALAAIYLEEKLGINAVETISVGFSVYLIGRSLFQIPVAEILDKHKSFIDETWAIAIGSLITGICVYLYIFISKPWHLYAVQLTIGLAFAMNIPAWRKAMAKFLDKGFEATEYTIYDIITNLFVALMTAIGGYIVSDYGGFTALFLVGGTIPILGSFVTLYLLKNRRIKHEYK